jgi:hypothetical protein
MEMTNLNAMDVDDVPLAPAKPRTLTVLALLVTAAATFSYLGAYAITDALVKSNVIRPFSRNPDPRPLWATLGFVGTMTAFLLVALLMRYLSGMQFRRIDRMGESEDA